MIVRLDEAMKNGNTTRKQLEISEFNEVTERGRQIQSQFDVLRGQVADNTLGNLIEAVRETQYEVNTARQPLIRFFNNPGDANINGLESAMKEDEELRQKVQERARLANKRIE